MGQPRLIKIERHLKPVWPVFVLAGVYEQGPHDHAMSCCQLCFEINGIHMIGYCRFYIEKLSHGWHLFEIDAHLSLPTFGYCHVLCVKLTPLQIAWERRGIKFYKDPIH